MFVGESAAKQPQMYKNIYMLGYSDTLRNRRKCHNKQGVTLKRLNT